MNKLTMWVLSIVVVAFGFSLIFQGSTFARVQAEVAPSAYAGISATHALDLLWGRDGDAVQAEVAPSAYAGISATHALDLLWGRDGTVAEAAY